MEAFSTVCCILSAILAVQGSESANEDEFTIIVSKPDVTIISSLPVVIPTPTLTKLNCGSVGGWPCTRLPFSGCYCPVSTQMHWRAAYDFCRSKGKSLLSIESLMKANEIKSYLPLLIGKDQKLVFGEIGFWTSGTLIPRTSTFKWASLPQFFRFTDWMDGEPNGVAINSNDCVRAIPTSNFQWGDVDCYQFLPFFCHSP